MGPANSNESYCTFTLAGDVTAGGLPSEAEIRKDLEDNDPQVSYLLASVLVTNHCCDILGFWIGCIFESTYIYIGTRRTAEKILLGSFSRK